MKKPTSIFRFRRVLAVLIAVMVSALAAPAFAVDLTVKKACISLPAGTVTDLDTPAAVCSAGTVQIWRFKRTDVAEVTPLAPGALVITAAEGDDLAINVSNELGIPVSLAIRGQAISNNTGPVWLTDINNPYGPSVTGSRPGGDVTSRVRSFAHEAPAGAPGAPGASTPYLWNNIRTGTYIITSGTHPSLQVQMGLYAALVVKTAGGAPYAGESVPDNEQVLLFSEIDPAIHNAANDVTKSFPETNAFSPKYFLINGKPFPGNDPLPAGTTGQSTLLRFLNAGLDTYMPMLQGPKVTGIAEDGYLIPDALRLQKNTVELHAGKTADVTLTNPAAAGYIPVYDRRLYLSNATQTPGGMLIYLEIPDATQHQLTVSTLGGPVGGRGTGKVAAESMPGGIYCDSSITDSDCTQAYNADTEIKLVPYANAGSLHTGWAVSPAGDPADNCPDISGADCVVTMNGAKTVTATFRAQSVVRLITPNGGEKISAGSRYTITWGAPANAVRFRLRYSLDNRATWILIDNNVTGNTYSWSVPIPSKNRNKAIMQVTGYNASGTVVGKDVSDTEFTIEVLTIVSPAVGESWTSGSGQGLGHEITWLSHATAGLVKSIVIDYTKNNGASWKPIVTLDNTGGNYNAGGTFTWQISPQVSANKPKSKVRIKLKDAGGNVIGKVVSNKFTITP